MPSLPELLRRQRRPAHGETGQASDILTERLAADIGGILVDRLGCDIERPSGAAKELPGGGIAAALPGPATIYSAQAKDEKGAAAGTAYVRMTDPSVLAMAALFLKSCDAPGEGEVPGPVDQLLLTQILDPVLDQIGALLSCGFERESETGPCRDWPMELATQSKVYRHISLRYPTTASAGLSIDILVPAKLAGAIAPPTTASEPATDPRARAMAANIPIRLSALIDQWQADSADLAQIRVGGILPLPGAGLESIRLAARIGNENVELASGEHGKSGRHQAIRLTSLKTGRS